MSLMKDIKEKAQLFETTVLNKSLTSMVKGIRAHKDDESEYISKCLTEIKEELRSQYPDIKSMAIRKLIYLQMIGYDISWAAFHIVEVMSANWFGHKRVGYLAASLSYMPTTDVILLTTHLFRKGFTGTTASNSDMSDGLKYETGAAINCVANIVNEGLAQDLLSDIYGLMNSSQPYVRKKAVLVLLKIFKRWPKALRMSFDRLKEKLDDENSSVVSAAVYVICELAARNPQNYLSLAPQFFKILTSTSHNWVLIKVVKLLGSLVPLEPRLAKKLNDPLVDIITTTPAKSLLYECVNTLLSGKLQSKDTVSLCLDKLKSFIEDPDQNLKYLGLLGLHKLMQQYPRMVSEHKDLILDCLKDDDVTIRMRALDLLTAMVSKRNLESIVKRLIAHLDTTDGAYSDQVLERILHICSQESFAFIEDFEWYLSTLIDLTHLQGVSGENAKRLTSDILAVVVRVPGLRRFAVGEMVKLLLSQRLLADDQTDNNMTEVLQAAAWVVGEFSRHLTREHFELVSTMLRSSVALLPARVQASFVHNSAKIFSAALSLKWNGSRELEDPALLEAVAAEERDRLEADEAATETEPFESHAEWLGNAKEIMLAMEQSLPVFCESAHVEVQERAVAYLSFLKWFDGASGITGTVKPAAAATTVSAPSPTSAGDKAAAAPAPAPAVSATAAIDMFDIGMTSPAPAPAAAPVAPPAESEAPEAAKPEAETIELDLGAAPQDSIETRRLTLALVDQFASFFAEPLPALPPNLQAEVALPAGLDLDKVINEEEDSESESEEEDEYRSSSKDDAKGKSDKKSRRSDDYDDEGSFELKPATAEEKEAAKKRQAAAKAARESDLFYIKDSSSNAGDDSIDINSIPVEKLNDDELPEGLDLEKKRKKQGRDRRRRDSFEEKKKGPVKKYTVAAVADVKSKAKTADAKKKDDLDMDLEKPLGEDEVITKPVAYADYRLASSPSGKDSKDKDSKDKDAKGKESKSRSSRRDEKDEKDDKKKDRHSDRKSRDNKDKREDREKDEKPAKDDKGSSRSSRRDGKEKAEKGDKVEKESKPAASSAPTPVVNVLDIFDPFAAEAPKPKSASSSSTPAAAAASPAASSSKDKSSRGASSTLFSDSTIKIKASVERASKSGSKGADAYDVKLSVSSKSSLAPLSLSFLPVKGVSIVGSAGGDAECSGSSDQGATVAFAKVSSKDSSQQTLLVSAKSFPITLKGEVSYKEKSSSGRSKKGVALADLVIG